jgi:hypothetical protein
MLLRITYVRKNRKVTELLLDNSSLFVPCGTWRGGLFTGDPAGYVEEGSGDGHLSKGAPLGNLEEDSITRVFERWMKYGPDNGHLSPLSSA